MCSTYPFKERQGRLESSLGAAEGKAESEVGELILQLDAETLLDLGELLLLLLGDGADPVRPGEGDHQKQHSVKTSAIHSRQTCSAIHACTHGKSIGR